MQLEWSPNYAFFRVGCSPLQCRSLLIYHHLNTFYPTKFKCWRSECYLLHKIFTSSSCCCRFACTESIITHISTPKSPRSAKLPSIESKRNSIAANLGKNELLNVIVINEFWRFFRWKHFPIPSKCMQNENWRAILMAITLWRRD